MARRAWEFIHGAGEETGTGSDGGQSPVTLRKRWWGGGQAARGCCVVESVPTAHFFPRRGDIEEVHAVCCPWLVAVICWTARVAVTSIMHGQILPFKRREKKRMECVVVLSTWKFIFPLFMKK
jgi:hypothetical protein